MIELKDVTFRWPDEEVVLESVSLAIEPGQKVVILGANGCGKSTLLKLMNGLVEPETGSLTWQGKTVTRASLRQDGFGKTFRSRCALLFQHPEAMLFNPSVRDELAYGPRQLGCTDTDARLQHWASELGLMPLLDKAPFLLSGGQKQKVALAAILTLDPDFLLLDEPSASLDPGTVGWLIDTLLHSDKTVVIATHNLSLAAELGERCIVLGERGKILFDGPTRMALTGTKLLERAGLAHRHRHRHGGVDHVHVHVHDWD
jgi:cobalt/nickel transport system ATP-binding protein